MLTNAQRVSYLLDSMLRFNEKVKCTNCGSDNCSMIDRKYFFTRLFECNSCHMYFRHPSERTDTNKKFYQKEYAEKDSVTAELPAPGKLAELKESRFRRGNKNADRYSAIFQNLFPGQEKISVLDYGSSWGYISWQLIEKGYDVQSFEISRPRAEYGNTHLGLNIVTDESQLVPGVDIFFSAHVIEHHPSVPSMIELAKKLLKPGGYFIAVSPNGSKAYRTCEPFGFHKAWGKVHPNYLNEDFYATVFAGNPFYLGSSPFNIPGITPLGSSDKIKDDLSGEELLAIVKF